MSPFVSNDLIFAALILFIVVSIAANTLNYMSVQTNKDMMKQDRENTNYIKNITSSMYNLVEQNNKLMKHSTLVGE